MKKQFGLNLLLKQFPGNEHGSFPFAGNVIKLGLFSSRNIKWGQVKVQYNGTP
jgi:hypothetical protein